MEKVSVIVPVYNNEKYVSECIESIINQSYGELEVILVDDGSVDNSGLLCDEYAIRDTRINVIHQKNKGVASARNRGIQSASGKYILFVDSDDYIEPNLIEMAVSSIKDADILSFGVYWEKSKECVELRNDKFCSGLLEGDSYIELLSTMIWDFNTSEIQRLTPYLCNKVFRRDRLVAASRCLDTRIFYGEDSTLLYLYLLEARSIYIMPEVLYHYRYVANSAVRKQRPDMLSNIGHIYENLFPFFSDSPYKDTLVPQLQKYISLRTCYAIDEQMGFDKRVKVLEFITDPAKFVEKKTIVYGCGKAGRDLVDFMMRYQETPVLWVDRDYLSYQSNGYNVKSPEEISSVDFECILVAVERQSVFEAIKKSLMKQGIMSDFIKWENPIRNY